MLTLFESNRRDSMYCNYSSVNLKENERNLETTRTLYIYVANETVGLTSCRTSDQILCQG